MLLKFTDNGKEVKRKQVKKNMSLLFGENILCQSKSSFIGGLEILQIANQQSSYVSLKCSVFTVIMVLGRGIYYAFQSSWKRCHCV